MNGSIGRPIRGQYENRNASDELFLWIWMESPDRPANLVSRTQCAPSKLLIFLDLAIVPSRFVHGRFTQFVAISLRVLGVVGWPISRQVRVGFREWNSSSTDCFGSLIRERSLRSFFCASSFCRKRKRGDRVACPDRPCLVMPKPFWPPCVI